MSTIAATITSKGQITIPSEIRKAMNLHSGDKINFIVEGDVVRFLPATKPITSLKGMVAKPKRPVSLDAMKTAVKARGSKP